MEQTEEMKTCTASLEGMEAETCSLYGITLRSLHGRTRLRRVTEARYALFSVLHDRLGMRISEIARRYGLNHATVIHGIRVISRLADVEPDTRERLQSILDAAKTTETERIGMYIEKRKAIEILNEVLALKPTSIQFIRNEFRERVNREPSPDITAAETGQQK